MYGTGFRGTLDGDAAWVVDQLGQYDGEVIAVDIPSGVDGRTGTVSADLKIVEARSFSAAAARKAA